MTAGHPLSFSSFVPRSMSGDDFLVALAGVAAFLCIFAIGNMFISRDRMAPRLKSLQERRTQLQGDLLNTKRRRKPEGSMTLMRAVVMKLRLLKSSQIGKTVSLLNEAGWRSKDALVIFAFFNLITPILLCILGIVLMKTDMHLKPNIAKFQLVLPILFAYIGLKLPGWVVGFKRRKRYYRIQKALADSLDLMMICAEAGLSLAAALDRVSRELGIAYPEMAEELSLTAIEMGFLPDRNKALTNLAERIKMAEVRGIVNVLVQTERYGTPIAQAMRVLASEFRTQRMLRAEQKAARLPALMTIPMILFILPTLFIVVISPAIIKLLDTVK